MSNIDVELPEVQSLLQRGRFYKDENGRELIEISFVGQKDTVVQFVTPEHMARYKREWDAYCDKQPLQLREGTPLSELFDEKSEAKYIAANIHNLEELAALDDSQCQGVGRGTLTDRQSARDKLVHVQFEADLARRKRIDELTPVATASTANEEISELRKSISDMQAGLQTLQEAMLLLVKKEQQQPAEPRSYRRRRGRPKGKRKVFEVAPSAPPEEPQ
jgi:hypothetical protein